MPLEEAARFWMTVDLGLLCRTDFSGMAALLEWALEVSGCQAWRESLLRLAEEACLTRTGLPNVVREGQKLVTLQLPETDVLRDPCWILQAIQLRTDEAGAFLMELLDEWFSDTSEEAKEDAMGDLFGSLEALFSDDPSHQVTSPLLSRLERLFATHAAWISGEGQPLAMMIDQTLPTLYFLVNMDPATGELRGLAMLLGEEWVSLGGTEEGSFSDDTMLRLLSGLGSFVLSMLLPADSAVTEELPVAGLESLTL